MKKMLALLLVAVLALSLCACGSNDNPYEKYANIFNMLEAGDYQGAISAIYMLQLSGGGNLLVTGSGNKETPTEEEEAMLELYYEIEQYLSDLVDGTYFDLRDPETGEYYRGQTALKFCYEKLPELSGVEKWADTDYVKDHGNYSEIETWDCQALLNGIQVVENVILAINSTTKDNLGNVSNNAVTSWDYNADGTVSRIDGENKAKPITAYTGQYYSWLEYDAQGRLVKKTSGWSQNGISAITTYTYDDAGNIKKEQVKTNTNETVYEYSYKDGRLAKIKWDESFANRYTIEYGYDAAGNVIKEVKTREYNGYEGWEKANVTIMEYTYAEGVLTAGTYTHQAWNNFWEDGTRLASQSEDQYTYTCDEQGRVLTATVIPGNTVDMYGEGKGEVVGTPGYESKTYEYTYGNYYIYTPAN